MLGGVMVVPLRGQQEVAVRFNGVCKILDHQGQGDQHRLAASTNGRLKLHQHLRVPREAPQSLLYGIELHDPFQLESDHSLVPPVRNRREVDLAAVPQSQWQQRPACRRHHRALPGGHRRPETVACKLQPHRGHACEIGRLGGANGESDPAFRLRSHDLRLQNAHFGVFRQHSREARLQAEQQRRESVKRHDHKEREREHRSVSHEPQKLLQDGSPALASGESIAFAKT
mmetsp:Transcript_115388/g.326112  ORF Transcript_115388/g.326112 Transcript_115388/m.326112 type:complete len:229 (+) Transcript_115388:1569-2255(+)